MAFGVQVRSSGAGVILQLAEAENATTGAKAAACGELARIAGGGSGEDRWQLLSGITEREEFIFYRISADG